MSEGAWACNDCERMWREESPSRCPGCGGTDIRDVEKQVRSQAPGVDVNKLELVNMSRIGPEEAVIERKGDGYIAAAECPHCGESFRWRVEELGETNMSACPGCGAGFELSLENPRELEDKMGEGRIREKLSELFRRVSFFD